jgi:ribosome-associated protein
MKEKKANRIITIDLRDISNPLADFFVICSGTSDKQVDAISDSVERFTFLQQNEGPWRTEGKNNFEWVILDYVNVVAHIFLENKRDFYGLEELWGDGKITEIEDIPSEKNKSI